MWPMSPFMSGVDRLTRQFWKVTGRPVDLDGAERWLTAPMHDSPLVGDTWLRAAAAAHEGTLVEDVAGVRHMLHRLPNNDRWLTSN